MLDFDNRQAYCLCAGQVTQISQAGICAVYIDLYINFMFRHVRSVRTANGNRSHFHSAG